MKSNKFVERLSKFLENDDAWEQSDLKDLRYRKFIRRNPPGMVLLEYDMERDLFLLHLQEFGFKSEDEFNTYCNKSQIINK